MLANFVFVLGLLFLIQTILELRSNKKEKEVIKIEEIKEQTPQETDKILNDIDTKLILLDESIKNNISSIDNTQKLNEIQKFLERIYNISNNNYKLSVNIENIEIDLRRIFAKITDLSLYLTNINLMLKNNNNNIESNTAIKTENEKTNDSTKEFLANNNNVNEELQNIVNEVVEDKFTEINNEELLTQPTEKKEEVKNEVIDDEELTEDLFNDNELVPSLNDISDITLNEKFEDNNNVKNVDLDIIKEKINNLKDKLQIKNPDERMDDEI